MVVIALYSKLFRARYGVEIMVTIPPGSAFSVLRDSGIEIYLGWLCVSADGLTGFRKLHTLASLEE